jgi:hypothetical protein
VFDDRRATRPPSGPSERWGPLVRGGSGAAAAMLTGLAGLPRRPHLRQTVLLATVLFLVAVAQRFRFRGVRIAASVVAGGLMVVALMGVIYLPRL